MEDTIAQNKPLSNEDEEYLLDLLGQLDPENLHGEIFPKIEVEEFKKSLEHYKKFYSDIAKEKLDESKFRLAGSKLCKRCSTKLGFKKYHPDGNWEIKGYLCRECYNLIKHHIANFPVIIKKGEVNRLKKKGILSIQTFDDIHRIVFGTKEEPLLLQIPVSSILRHDFIEFEEDSKLKQFLTLGRKKTQTKPHYLIVYKVPHAFDRDLIFHSEELSKISSSIGNLILEFENSKLKDNDFEDYKIS